MARTQSRIRNTVPPIKADDFSLIKGIGPVLAKRLNDVGVCTYDQLASLSPARLAEMVTGLSAKQISKQDWSGQARKLAAPKTQSQPSQKDSPKRSIRQHYENFTVEFLVDEKHALRRTRVAHIQSGDADTWAGWKADQLIDFLARHAGIRILAKKLEEKESFPVLIPPPNNTHPEPGPPIVKIGEPMAQQPDVQEVPQPPPVPQVIQSSGNSGPTGTLHLQDFCVLSRDSDTPAHSLHQGQPCQARLTLDLTSVIAPNEMPLQYKVTITFKQLAGARYPVAEENHPIERSGCVTLNLPCTTPPPGIYRPDAFVNLFSDKTELGLLASLQGELIQVI